MGIIERIIAILTDEISEDVSTELLAKIDEVLTQRLGEYNQAIDGKLIKIEEVMGILADKIAALTAVETAEGAVIVKANGELKAALEAAKSRIVELESIAGSVPALQEQVDALKADLASAEVAAEAIAGINPTPVSDGLVEEVVENPEIPTPPVVEQAPEVAPEVIQEQPVVDAAIEALEAAPEEVSPVSPG